MEYRELLDRDSVEQAWANNIGLDAFCRVHWGRKTSRMRLIEEFINVIFYYPEAEELVGYAGLSSEKSVIDKPLIARFFHS